MLTELSGKAINGDNHGRGHHTGFKNDDSKDCTFWSLSRLCWLRQYFGAVRPTSTHEAEDRTKHASQHQIQEGAVAVLQYHFRLVRH